MAQTELLGLQQSRSFKAVAQKNLELERQQSKQEQSELGRQPSRSFKPGRQRNLGFNNLVLLQLPAILSMYLIGAGLALLVCTRSFFFLQQQQPPPPVHLQSFQYLPMKSDNNFVTSQRTSTRLANRAEGPAKQNDVQVLQPRSCSKTSKFCALETRHNLHRMTPRKRRMWLKDNWSTFQILQADVVSDRFLTRMNSFLCGSTTTIGNHSEYWSEETCGGVKSNPCQERFFFTWISPTSSGFGEREQLAIESVFKWHPSACVVILSRSLDTRAGEKILKPLTSRGYRIMAVTPDHENLFRDTPAAQWFRKLRDGLQDPGDINLMQNLSNIMRLVVLYKYGGIYLDTDMIVLKKLSHLRNSVGAQSMNPATGKWSRLNNAALVFDRNHSAVWHFIQEFERTFDGRRWGYNGPYLVSRVVSNHRHDRDVSVSVLPKPAFYPYNWMGIKSIFRAPANHADTLRQESELSKLTQGSYAIHLWNRNTGSIKVEKGSIMDKLFQHSCIFCEAPS